MTRRPWLGGLWLLGACQMGTARAVDTLPPTPAETHAGLGGGIRGYGSFYAPGKAQEGAQRLLEKATGSTAALVTSILVNADTVSARVEHADNPADFDDATLDLNGDLQGRDPVNFIFCENMESYTFKLSDARLDRIPDVRATALKENPEVSEAAHLTAIYIEQSASGQLGMRADCTSARREWQVNFDAAGNRISTQMR